MSAVPVTLQISLAPSDWRHARELLPHQVRTWRGQVAEILLTIDYHRSGGRFSARWEEGKDRIGELAASVEGARVVAVDYGEAAAKRVADQFFGGSRVPIKDFRGGPYFSYFYGLTEATHDHVMHVDSDMFFGGGSLTWMAEATACLEEHPEVIFTAPLPGPPSADQRTLKSQQQAKTVVGQHYAFDFEDMSTRLFLCSRKALADRIGPLSSRLPKAWRNVIKAIIERNAAEDLPEHLFSDLMRANGLVRRDFLGKGPGMWSLHPPYRCADFYDKLTELIRRVEAGDVPESQRGDHDVNGSLVDWSESLQAMRENRWWKRLLRSR